MNVWNWIVENFMNGELFFYIIPVFLLILLIIVIFLPEEDEIEKEEEAPVQESEESKKRKRKTVDLNFVKSPELDEKVEQDLGRTTKEILETDKEKESVPTTLKDAVTEAAVKTDVTAPSAEKIEIEETKEIETPEPAKEIPPEIEPAEKTPVEEPVEEEHHKSIQEGLEKTRGGFISKLKNIFKASVIDDDLMEEMEEILYTADIGTNTVNFLLTEVEKNRKSFSSGEDVRTFLKKTIDEILKSVEKELIVEKKEPSILLMVGVNGAGKTTTTGKLSLKFKTNGMTSVLAAGDTFRAAAVGQLKEWGNRTGMDVVYDKDGADPASVAFNAITSAKSKGADIVLVDTAGRLQNRVNLMEELKKVHRVIGKAKEGAPHEVILVVDANNGQNALNQAKEFNQSVNLSGIIITKLDGTAKGGVVIGIARELKLPIYYIGIGERVEDLQQFKADEFVEALFS